MEWAYGLVQKKEGLMLCEIYFKDKPVMYVPVDWEDINENIEQVMEDIKQMKYKLKEEDF